jgi:putative transcriptional regulator
MIRKRLFELRIAKSMTQEEVADKAGISRSFYSLIESGDRNPSYGLAKTIAVILGGDTEELFLDLDGYRMKPPVKEKTA